MPERPLRVTIAADTIPYIEGGLGYFLFNAVSKLAETQPSWQFKVVATSSFKELAQIQSPNVKLIFFDQSLLQRTMRKVLGRFLPDGYVSAGNYVLSQHMPTQWLRVEFGNLKALYGSMRDTDVVWLPHYAIADGYRFSSLENLSLLRSPILFTIHDIHPIFFPDDWSLVALNKFRKGFVPFAQRSECIITHTQFQKAAIVEHLGIEPAKVLVTHCPPLIDPAVLLKLCDRAEIQALLSRYHISPLFVLYPGSGSHTHKNHIRLLLAWAELRKRLGNNCPTLVCTAKGHLWPALKALIDALGLQDKVVFTDTVDTDTLVKLYQGCALVVVPTLYEGGGSGPVAEAYLAGKPVVCSRIPQIEEQLQWYGVRYITYFDPNSVDSIADAVESALARFPELESQTKEDQKRLLPLVPQMWEEWAGFYAEQIRRIANSRAS